MNLGRPAPPPTYPEWPDLLDEASARARRPVDPAGIYKLEETIDRRGNDWCTAVLGYAYPGLRYISHTHAEVLRVADERGIEPPLPRYITEGRERERLRREAVAKMAADRQNARNAEWTALAGALPVPAVVLHNYESHRHYDGYVQGVDHIVLLEDLRVGRLARARGEALCETPSNAKNLDFPEFPTPDQDRRPSCKTCIRTACRVTGREAPTLLDPNA